MLALLFKVQIKLWITLIWWEKNADDDDEEEEDFKKFLISIMFCNITYFLQHQVSIENMWTLDLYILILKGWIRRYSVWCISTLFRMVHFDVIPFGLFRCYSEWYFSTLFPMVHFDLRTFCIFGVIPKGIFRC